VNIFLFQEKMAGSDSDVLEIIVDPEEEKKNCEGRLSLEFVIVFSRQNILEFNSGIVMI
jgi:hypothetical protein